MGFRGGHELPLSSWTPEMGIWAAAAQDPVRGGWSWPPLPGSMCGQHTCTMTTNIQYTLRKDMMSIQTKSSPHTKKIKPIQAMQGRSHILIALQERRAKKLA